MCCLNSGEIETLQEQLGYEPGQEVEIEKDTFRFVQPTTITDNIDKISVVESSIRYYAYHKPDDEKYQTQVERIKKEIALYERDYNDHTKGKVVNIMIPWGMYSSGQNEGCYSFLNLYFLNE